MYKIFRTYSKRKIFQHLSTVHNTIEKNILVITLLVMNVTLHLNVNVILAQLS